MGAFKSRHKPHQQKNKKIGPRLELQLKIPLPPCKDRASNLGKTTKKNVNNFGNFDNDMPLAIHYIKNAISRRMDPNAKYFYADILRSKLGHRIYSNDNRLEYAYQLTCESLMGGSKVAIQKAAFMYVLNYIHKKEIIIKYSLNIYY